MFPLGLWESRSSVSGPTRSKTLAKNERFKLQLKVTSSQGSELKKKMNRTLLIFLLCTPCFLASVNILFQNTKQDGAAHQSIMRTGTETGVKEMIQWEGVTSGVQINSYTEAVRYNNQFK